MIDDVRAAATDAANRISAAGTLEELRTLELELLGKKGVLAGFKSRLGSIDADQRRVAGQAVNEAMAAAQQAHDDRAAALQGQARTARLAAERLDLTEVIGRPQRGHAHLVTRVWERLEDVFTGMGFTIAEGPEVETDDNNFTFLNMAPGHSVRSEFDTLFVDYGPTHSTVLRTHTSPVQVRTMQSVEPPIYIVAPGRVFRRDTPDATHMPVFHQIEGLVIDRGITLADLAGTIQAFTEAFFGPGFGSRLRPSYFPFTEPSAEFDIQRPDGTWMELGGCGMVHPDVLSMSGIDPEIWSGYAFGFGIDRFVLPGYGVDDIREIFTDDIRFIEQF